VETKPPRRGYKTTVRKMIKREKALKIRRGEYVGEEMCESQIRRNRKRQGGGRLKGTGKKTKQGLESGQRRKSTSIKKMLGKGFSPIKSHSGRFAGKRIKTNESEKRERNWVAEKSD